MSHPLVELMEEFSRAPPLRWHDFAAPFGCLASVVGLALYGLYCLIALLT